MSIRHKALMEKKNAIMVTEFNRYVVEHPEFASKIPKNAQVVLRVNDDPEYNEWVKKIAEKQREEGQPVVYVQIKGLKPVRSRLIRPMVQKSA